MNSCQKFVALLVAVGTAASSSLALAQTNEAPKSVEQRIEKLDQEIKILKRQRELEQDAADAKKKEIPVLTAGQDGFSFKSADSSFILKMRGQIQTDARFYLDEKANTVNDTFLIRRLRPIFEGTLWKDFDFRIMPNFGQGTTVLDDAYLEWKHFPELKLRIGKFKTPGGLEELQEDAYTLFTERGLPFALVPNRDVGIQLSGDLWDSVISYAAGIFNGVADGANGDLDNGDPKDLAGRLFVQPFKKTDIEPLQGLGLGIAGTFGHQSGKTNALNLASYKTTGQQTFFTYITSTGAPGPAFAHGDRTRWSPQGYYYWGPFGMFAEYVVSDQDVQRGKGGSQERISNSAWQAAGSFVLTGEKASYKGVTPKHPFDLKGGWGAVELAARYGELHIDHSAFPTFADPAKSARDAHEWAVGLNWYLSRNVKFMMDYDQTTFDSGAAGGGDRSTEKVVFGRAQLVF